MFLLFWKTTCFHFEIYCSTYCFHSRKDFAGKRQREMSLYWLYFLLERINSIYWMKMRNCSKLSSYSILLNSIDQTQLKLFPIFDEIHARLWPYAKEFFFLCYLIFQRFNPKSYNLSNTIKLLFWRKHFSVNYHLDFIKIIEYFDQLLKLEYQLSSLNTLNRIHFDSKEL